MHLSTLLLGGGLVPLAFAAYVVQDDYSGNNFFNMFTFDTEDDPTHGYVNYVDQGTAQGAGLIGVNNGVVTIRSDSTNKASGRGRNSVRVTSKKQYTHGLVALDLEHMPGGACGIWPAFWMTGPNWPNSGEIDIIEGVNYQGQNAMTMHTGPGCSLVGKDCQGNQGCGLQTGGSGSYGDGFNQAKGGVYVMEWTTQNINIWFFNRGEIPGDLTAGNPNPLKWKWPTAQFLGGSSCNIDDHFKNNNIVFDTTFCGDWAGGVWSQTPQCSSRAATCQDFVRDNPSAFNEAYWTIRSLKVYSWQQNQNQKTAAAAPQTEQKNAAPVAAPKEQPAQTAQPPAQKKPAGSGSGSHMAVSMKEDGSYYLRPIDRRSPVPAPHRGLSHLPAEEKIVNDGANVPIPQDKQPSKRSLEEVIGIENRTTNGGVGKRSIDEVLAVEEQTLEKRAPHRGLKEAPSGEKVHLSGDGLGKNIGIDKVSRVKRHLGVHQGHVRS